MTRGGLAGGRSAARVLLTMAVIVVGAACTHTPPKTSADAAPLQVPPPPAREAGPLAADAPPPLPLPAEPEHTAPSSVLPPRPGPARPAPPPAAATEPARAAADDAARPAPSLQTAPASGQTEVERAVRTLLARAGADLARVDQRRLSTDARAQYDTARRFIAQADEALRARNLVFAHSLADKAATLAAGLAGR